MKNVTILTTSSEAANLALGVVAGAAGIAATLAAKKRAERKKMESLRRSPFKFPTTKKG